MDVAPGEALLAVDVRRSGPTLIVTLDGDLELGATAALVPTVLRRLDPEIRGVTLDATDLGFCGSTGLRALLALRSELRDRSVDLVLQNPARIIRRVLAVTGIDTIIDIR